jgi:hypothetical protein
MSLTLCGITSVLIRIRVRYEGSHINHVGRIRRILREENFSGRKMSTAVLISNPILQEGPGGSVAVKGVASLSFTVRYAINEILVKRARVEPQGRANPQTQ